MREKAAVQKQKAETRNKAMEALVNKTLQKQERLLAKQKEVAQLMVNHNESQYEWRTNNSELEKMQKNLTAENRLYEELKKKVEQQIVNLTDMQEQAYQRLGMLQNAVEKKQDEVLTLRDKAENHGSIARNASRAADEECLNADENEDIDRFWPGQPNGSPPRSVPAHCVYGFAPMSANQVARFMNLGAAEGRRLRGELGIDVEGARQGAAQTATGGADVVDAGPVVAHQPALRDGEYYVLAEMV
eukprot:symbB.v1.2.039601.t1/scaffold6676.1/size16274/3